MKKIIALAVLLLILTGCLQLAEFMGVIEPENEEEAKEMETEKEDSEIAVVENGDKVKVEYIGRFPDGEVFDKSEGRGPLEFTAGGGQMIKGFDAAVIGMKLNEEKTITIPPEEAYGAEGSSSHALAGKTLEFWINVVEIEKAN